MIKNFILAIIVIGIAAGLTFGLNHYFKSQRGEFFVLEQEKAVPDFTFKTTNGTGYKLSDFKGKDVIVHFWASWCAPCVVEFPELGAYAKKNPNTIILAFSSDKSIQIIERFLKIHSIPLSENFLIIHDEDKIITEDKFNVFQLPESFILDKNLQLKNHIIGAYKNWGDISI